MRHFRESVVRLAVVALLMVVAVAVWMALAMLLAHAARLGMPPGPDAIVRPM